MMKSWTLPIMMFLAYFMLMWLMLPEYGEVKPMAAEIVPHFPSLNEQGKTAFLTSPQVQSAHTDAYTSSRQCAKCHEEIYQSWQVSMHSKSVVNPVFRAAYSQAYERTDGKAKNLCLRCHAPTTIMSGDYQLQLPVSQEGVTCDFCHTISAVDLSHKDQPFTIELGLTKFGPSKDSEATTHTSHHPVRFSQLHSTSRLCAGCHEYQKANGLHIRQTYSEWVTSPYAAQGKECQSCHMPSKRGQGGESTPTLFIGPEPQKQGFFKTHDLSRSLAQLQEVIRLKITDIERLQNKMIVHAELTNFGAGHMVPTGSPSKKLVLKVSVKADGHRPLEAQLVYQKILADDKGRHLNTDCDIMLEGARLVMDNLLAPGESRQEELAFPVPRGIEAQVRAQLFYNYEPMVLQEVSTEIEMAEVGLRSGGL